MSALPYLAMWLLAFPLSYLADWAIERDVTVVVVRKFMNTLATWGPALGLLLICNVSASNQAIIVLLLIASVGINAGVMCGFQINHIDLSPNFAGAMLSITNGLANFSGILAPIICGIIVYEEVNFLIDHEKLNFDLIL